MGDLLNRKFWGGGTKKNIAASQLFTKRAFFL